MPIGAGDFLYERNGGSHNQPGEIAELNWGLNRLGGNYGNLRTGSGGERLDIDSSIHMPSDWVIGETVRVNQSTNDGLGNTAGMRSNLFLTSIAATYPVPEPSTYLLLGSGILGLAYWRRRKLKG